MRPLIRAVLVSFLVGAPHAQAAEAGAAPADAAAEAAAPAPTAAPETPRKMICTREKPIGSNQSVRVCRESTSARGDGDRSRESFERLQEQRANTTDSQ